MLVYHKEPMGYTSIGRYRIYGRHFSYGRFGATEIPLKLYIENKGILKEKPITGAWLSKKFNKKFPTITFKCSEMYKTNYNASLR